MGSHAESSAMGSHAESSAMGSRAESSASAHRGLISTLAREGADPSLGPAKATPLSKGVGAKYEYLNSKFSKAKLDKLVKGTATELQKEVESTEVASRESQTTIKKRELLQARWLFFLAWVEGEDDKDGDEIKAPNVDDAWSAPVITKYAETFLTFLVKTLTPRSGGKVIKARTLTSHSMTFIASIQRHAHREGNRIGAELLGNDGLMSRVKDRTLHLIREYDLGRGFNKKHYLTTPEIVMMIQHVINSNVMGPTHLMKALMILFGYYMLSRPSTLGAFVDEKTDYISFLKLRDFSIAKTGAGAYITTINLHNFKGHFGFHEYEQVFKIQSVTKGHNLLLDFNSILLVYLWARKVLHKPYANVTDIFYDDDAQVQIRDECLDEPFFCALIPGGKRFDTRVVEVNGQAREVPKPAMPSAFTNSIGQITKALGMGWHPYYVLRRSGATDLWIKIGPDHTRKVMGHEVTKNDALKHYVSEVSHLNVVGIRTGEVEGIVTSTQEGLSSYLAIEAMLQADKIKGAVPETTSGKQPSKKKVHLQTHYSADLALAALEKISAQFLMCLTAEQPIEINDISSLEAVLAKAKSDDDSEILFVSDDAEQEADELSPQLRDLYKYLKISDDLTSKWAEYRACFTPSKYKEATQNIKKMLTQAQNRDDKKFNFLTPSDKARAFKISQSLVDLHKGLATCNQARAKRADRYKTKQLNKKLDSGRLSGTVEERAKAQQKLAVTPSLVIQAARDAKASDRKAESTRPEDITASTSSNAEAKADGPNARPAAVLFWDDDEDEEEDSDDITNSTILNKVASECNLPPLSNWVKSTCAAEPGDEDILGKEEDEVDMFNLDVPKLKLQFMKRLAAPVEEQAAMEACLDNGVYCCPKCPKMLPPRETNWRKLGRFRRHLETIHTLWVDLRSSMKIEDSTALKCPLCDFQADVLEDVQKHMLGSCKGRDFFQKAFDAHEDIRLHYREGERKFREKHRGKRQEVTSDEEEPEEDKPRALQDIISFIKQEIEAETVSDLMSEHLQDLLESIEEVDQGVKEIVMPHLHKVE